MSPPDGRRLLVADRAIDGTGADPIEGCAVLLDGDRMTPGDPSADVTAIRSVRGFWRDGRPVAGAARV